MNKEMNMVDFCLQLLENFTGSRVQRLIALAPPLEHIAVKSGMRQRCAYCALNDRESRSRFQCNTCLVPLCSVGTGKAGTNCFSLAHKSNEMKRIVKLKHQRMETMVNKRYKGPNK